LLNAEKDYRHLAKSFELLARLVCKKQNADGVRNAVCVKNNFPNVWNFWQVYWVKILPETKDI